MRHFWSERKMKYGNKKGSEEIYRNIMFDANVYMKTRKKRPRPTGGLFFYLKFFNESRRF